MKAIHINDARRILDSREEVDLKLWKSNGDILEYKGVKCISNYFRGGTRKVRFPNSNEVREFRDVCIFEINGMEVYL